MGFSRGRDGLELGEILRGRCDLWGGCLVRFLLVAGGCRGGGNCWGFGGVLLFLLGWVYSDPCFLGFFFAGESGLGIRGKVNIGILVECSFSSHCGGRVGEVLPKDQGLTKHGPVTPTPSLARLRAVVGYVPCSLVRSFV